MRTCPNCGAPVNDSQTFCDSCGRPIPVSPPEAKPHRGGFAARNRGLIAAIVIVSCLCVITAGLWILWPQISPSGNVMNNLPRAPLTTSTPTPVPDPPATEAPVEESPAPETVTELSVGSKWTGYLVFDNYEGDEEPEDDVKMIWAVIDVNRSGSPFFEIYDTEELTDDTVILLSYYIELYSDHFVPIIGDRDAWFYRIYLDQNDVEPFTVYLIGGSLSFTYHYVSSSESFDAYVLLFPKE